MAEKNTMINGKYLFKKWGFTTIILAGTIIRFMYGFYSKAWLGAPDQLAWGLGIDEMLHSKAWSYVQLVHAPHEGADLFIGLLSLLFRPLSFILPSLSFAALAIDILARWVEIKITQKLFGNQTAFWFGIWTILSVPALIPWATVNFGLHSLTSFIPFVFIYFTIVYKDNKYLPVLCAIISGIAVSLSYDSIILIPASIIFLLSLKNALKTKAFQVIIFLVVFGLTVIPHMLCRKYLYTDLSLQAGNANAFAIRGASLNDLFSGTHFKNICAVWFKPLPGSFLLSFINFLPALLIQIIVLIFLFAGAAFYLLDQTMVKHEKYLPVYIIVLFIAAYAFSPFYEDAYNNKRYVYYRHLCYIIPLIAALLINGFVYPGKLKRYLLPGWIALCGIASLEYMFNTKPIEKPAYKPAGWILAQKFGGDVNRLFKIASVAETQYQSALLTGFGWGFSAALLRDKHDSASVERLVQIVNGCPANDKPAIMEGVHYSFSNGITPVLDPKLLLIMDSKLTNK